MSDASVSDDLDVLLARITAHTAALQQAGGDSARARMLITDLSRVAARLRADATALRETMSGILDQGGDPVQTLDEP